MVQNTSCASPGSLSGGRSTIAEKSQRSRARRRKDLTRHRPPDVPHFIVDDGPEHELRIAGEFERRPVDDRREIATLPSSAQEGPDAASAARCPTLHS